MDLAPSATEARDLLADRLVDSAIPAMELLSVHLGLELGLYRALDSGATEDELATRAGIAPRYAREWLEHQTVSGFLDCDDASRAAPERVYRMPPGHAEVFLDADSPFHTAPLATMLAGVARAMPLLPEAFRTGGGVPYGVYGAEIRNGIRALNRPSFVHDLASAWLPAMPDVVARLSVEPGARVLDLGCGEGSSTIAMARAYPLIRATGVDLDEPSILAARAAAERAGLGERVTFEVGDASRVGDRGPFDLATIFEALHDMSDPVGVLRSVRANLGPRGVLFIADERVADEFAPTADASERLSYGFSVLHCLPATMAEDPVEAAGTVLRAPTVDRWAEEAGFGACTRVPIEHDFWQFYRMDRA
ncbi:MAG TPA: methyltransferase domain-containing protein [Micromonosporaceae bacterium]